MSTLKVNEIQIFNGTTVTITATTTEISADLNVGADLDVTGALTLGTALAIAEGGTGATDAATARTNLDVDQAGTDNSTDCTLITTSHDYLSIAGQAITLGPIDLTADVTGTLPIANGGTGQTSASAARIGLLPTLGSAGQVLAVNTGATDVEWVDASSGGANLPIDLTTDVTGTLPTSNGGTGVTALSSLDAADLGSGAATDGYVLTADGSGGAAWEAATGGGGGTTAYVEHSDTISDSFTVTSGTNRMYIGGTTFSGTITVAGRLAIVAGPANFTGTINTTGTLFVVG